MSSSNLSARAMLDLTSLTILQIQFPASVAWVVVCLPSSVINLVLFVAIAKTKSLRTNFYLCLMHGALADCLLSFFYGITGVKRLCLYLWGWPETTAPILCAAHFFPAGVFAVVGNSQALTIAFDRLMCLAAPVKYIKFRIRRLQLINLACWMIPTVVLIVCCIFFISHSPLVSNCTLGIIWTPNYGAVFSHLVVALLATMCVLYCTLVVLLIIRVIEARKKGATKAETKERLQIRGVITCFMLVGIYVALGLSDQVFVAATNSLDGVTKAKTQPVFAAVGLVQYGLGAVISIGRNQDIQQAIWSMLGIKNTVSPFASNQ